MKIRMLCVPRHVGNDRRLAAPRVTRRRSSSAAFAGDRGAPAAGGDQ